MGGKKICDKFTIKNLKFSLISLDGEGFTVFHRAVALNFIECLDTMISCIDDRDIKLEVDEDDNDDDYYSRRKKSGGPKKEKGNLIQHLIIKSEDIHM